MDDQDNIIRSGPLKGKKFEFAPTSGVEMFWEISEDFMERIFDFQPGEYLITDESSLTDFTGLDDMKLSDIQSKIQQIYGLDVSEIKSGNLLEIFTKIHKSRYGDPMA